MIWDMFMQDIKPGDVVLYPNLAGRCARMQPAIFVKQTMTDDKYKAPQGYTMQLAIETSETRMWDDRGVPHNSHQTTYFKMRLVTLTKGVTEIVKFIDGDDLEKIRETFGQPICGQDLDPFVMMQKRIFKDQGVVGKDRSITNYVESCRPRDGVVT